MIPALSLTGEYGSQSDTSIEALGSDGAPVTTHPRSDKTFSNSVKMSVLGKFYAEQNVPYPTMDSPAPAPVSDNAPGGVSATPAAADPKKMPNGPMEGMVATKVDNTYYLTISPFFFTDMDHERLTRLKAWGHLILKPTDQIRLSFGEQMFFGLPPVYFATLLNQIDVFCAPTTAVLDRRLTGSECLMAFACDTLEVREFGWMTLYPVSRDIPESRSPTEAAMVAYPLELLQKAVANGWIAQEDYDQLENGEPVLLTYEDFLARKDTAQNLVVI